MKRSEFPEKAYEAFINHELLSKGYMIYIPSQRREKSVGYDALWHTSCGRKIKAIALQYKIVSEYVKPPISLSTPAFKFDLHKSAKGYVQHNIMVKRNTTIWLKISAVYCVPSFVDYKSLYDYLKKGTLLNNSRFLIPTNKITDNKYHYIAFDNKIAYQFSQDPNLVENYSLDSIFERQESLCYEDLIQSNYIDEKTQTTKLDDYLIKTHSFLVIKAFDN